MYLPFNRDQLGPHFAAVSGASLARQQQPSYIDRHLKYYTDRADVALRHQRDQHVDTGQPSARPVGCSAKNHQVEKDERFWVVSALMSLFHSGDRTGAFSGLLSSALPTGPRMEGLDTWADALAEDANSPLQLFFEVNLPSPSSYRTWLQRHVDERTLLPWIRAKNVGDRQEGATKADAMLIAPRTGFAAVFEAKVLSDAGTHTERDALRNQIARNLDVLLDRNPRLQSPLNGRRPERTSFVLLTPALFKSNPSTRLYGSLMQSYGQDTALLQEHLPHRSAAELEGVPSKVGWTTFEECDRIVEGACRWLRRPPPEPIGTEGAGLRDADCLGA